jgi:RHS repeat-associated protein
MAQFVGNLMLKNGNTYQLITDHLGSVRLVVNVSDGTIAQQLDYDEYGNITQNTNSDFQPFGYAGGLYDAQIKLVRFGARDYDASVGRWTCKDPIGFKGGINLYNYVINNSINDIDPKGTDIWLEGPSGEEPPGHLSINVGDPTGEYLSYSFGVNGDEYLGGEVYLDTQHGGNFFPGYYLKTDAWGWEDFIASAYLNSLLGTKDAYRPWRTCRTFSMNQFEILKNAGLGTPVTPPSRTTNPNNPSFDVPFPYSTTVK